MIEEIPSPKKLIFRSDDLAGELHYPPILEQYERLTVLGKLITELEPRAGVIITGIALDNPDNLRSAARYQHNYGVETPGNETIISTGLDDIKHDFMNDPNVPTVILHEMAHIRYKTHRHLVLCDYVTALPTALLSLRKYPAQSIGCIEKYFGSVEVFNHELQKVQKVLPALDKFFKSLLVNSPEDLADRYSTLPDITIKLEKLIEPVTKGTSTINYLAWLKPEDEPSIKAVKETLWNSLTNYLRKKTPEEKKINLSNGMLLIKLSHKQRKQSI
jgi:hypothetical protein